MDTGVCANGTLRESSFHHYHYDGPDNFLQIAVADGLDEISLLISAKTGTIPQSGPKALRDAIVQAVAQPNTIDSLRRTRHGKVLVETKSTETAQSLLNVTHLFDIPVDVYVLKDTITTRFLLRNIDTTVSCAEIAEELRYSDIIAIEVRRFLRKTDESSEPTTTVLVTKLGTTLPPSTKLWYQNFRISPFWDTPRACKKCFRYGHSTASCRQAQRCHRCGEDHTGDCLAPVPKCTNCKGEHDALDKTCPRYRRELEIQKLKSRYHLTIGEARKRFSSSTTSQGTSYAQVVTGSSSPSPVAPDHPTRSDLEQAILSVSQQISAALQEFLVSLQHTLHDYLAPLSQSQAAIDAALQSLGSRIDALSRPLPTLPVIGPPNKKLCSTTEARIVCPPLLQTTTFSPPDPTSSCSFPSSSRSIQLERKASDNLPP